MKVVDPVEKEKPLPQVSVEIIQGAKRVETKFQAEGR